MRFQYKETFWLSFDDNDKRRDQTFLAVKNSATQPATGSNFGVVLKKFSGTYYTDEGVHRLDADGPVYRYAETLLLMAEIENDLGNDPSTYINQIRERAYGQVILYIPTKASTTTHLQFCTNSTKNLCSKASVGSLFFA